MSLWQQSWRLLSFMGIQYTLGRRGSYPYGLLIHYSLAEITVLVLISDVIQTFVLLTLFGRLSRRLAWLRKHLERSRQKRAALPERSWRSRLYRHRFTALLLISALPYGGGSLSGSFFALSSDSPKLKAFIIILSGCFLCSLLYYFSFAALFTQN